MPMQDPPHPGQVVRSDCLEPLGLTVTRAAEGLGVTRQALSDLVNGHAGISVDMALRLSKAFGPSPETWLRMQMGLRPLASPQSGGRAQRRALRTGVGVGEAIGSFRP